MELARQIFWGGKMSMQVTLLTKDMRSKKSKYLNLKNTLRTSLFLRSIAYFIVSIGGISGFGVQEARGQSGAGHLPDYTRYVIVIDSTFSMRRYQEDIEKALIHWLDDGWGGRASGGDGVSIWTYSQYGENALLETKTWRIRAQQKLLDQSLIAMGEIRYFGRARSKEILGLLSSSVASGTPLTVLWITDGKSDFAGSPFDSEIVKIFKSQQEFIKKAKIPFVLTLESEGKEFAAWGVNRLTLEAPPFLLPPSPAFEVATTTSSSSTKNDGNDDYEIADAAQEKITAEAELSQNAVNLAISEQETFQAPQHDDAADQIGNPKQTMELESNASPTLAAAGDINPLGELAKKINSIQTINSEPDSKSNASENTEVPPKSIPITSLKEPKSNPMEETIAIPIKLADTTKSSPPADHPQEKTINQKSSEKLSPDKPVRLSKKTAADNSRQDEIVSLNKKNPLRYFGLSFLFLALAIGLAWTARQILFPTTAKTATSPASVTNSSKSLKNQLQDAKKGKGSLISVTQTTQAKAPKNRPKKTVKERKKN